MVPGGGLAPDHRQWVAALAATYLARKDRVGLIEYGGTGAFHFHSEAIRRFICSAHPAPQRSGT